VNPVHNSTGSEPGNLILGDAEPACRIGLGCMRLSTDLADDPDSALATIAAALNAGFALFDTARAYSPSEEDLGHNERLLARALQAHPRGRFLSCANMRLEGAQVLLRRSQRWREGPVSASSWRG
jgi:hypothetical protein